MSVIEEIHNANALIVGASRGIGLGFVKALLQDSDIAKIYKIADSKVQYVMKFGEAEYIKRKLIAEVDKTPYYFLFDETTTMQVKK